MRQSNKLRPFVCLPAVLCLLIGASAINAQQVRRYEPSRPTVSPYLDLFRFRDSNLPNYYTYVRPLQREQEFQQRQALINNQQTRTLRQLQTNVGDLNRAATAGPLVAPTGKGSWFARPGSRSTFLDTSRYYSQSGSGAGR
jgi:hypothetical protein